MGIYASLVLPLGPAMQGKHEGGEVTTQLAASRVTDRPFCLVHSIEKLAHSGWRQ